MGGQAVGCFPYSTAEKGVVEKARAACKTLAKK
jgi:hypothetical protein